MEKRETFQVEVVYGRSDIQVLIPVDVQEGATLRDAIEHSGVLERFPEIELEKSKVGVFGKLSKLDTVLRAKDRVEIYRPLIADPKAVRQQRAAEGKTMKRGGGDTAN